MKTTELIPLILLELSTGDKYGIELSKSIEEKSNGKVVIKQPTLYTILKKLEKSKFISSFWQDSEIGGKRHYYRLTQNGKMQVSTLPDFYTLVNSLSNDDEDESALQNSPSNNSPSPVQQNMDLMSEPTPSKAEIQAESPVEQNIEPLTNSIAEPEKYVSIMDLLLEDNQNNGEEVANSNNVENQNETQAEIKESVLPSDEVFSSDNLDNATEVEINQQNSQILKDENKNKEEKFASNESVSKFTETSVQPLSNDYVSKLKDEKSDNSVKSFLNYSVESEPVSEDDIKYVEYVNLKTDKNHIYSKKLAKNMLYRILSSSAYLLFMLIISSIAISNAQDSPLYYIFLITSILLILFSITIYMLNYEKFRLKHKYNPLKINLKKQIIIATSLFLGVFILCIIVSVASGVKNIFAFSNFANLYAPLLLTSTVYLDVLFTHIFLIKKL